MNVGPGMCLLSATLRDQRQVRNRIAQQPTDWRLLIDDRPYRQVSTMPKGPALTGDPSPFGRHSPPALREHELPREGGRRRRCSVQPRRLLQRMMPQCPVVHQIDRRAFLRMLEADQRGAGPRAGIARDLRPAQDFRLVREAAAPAARPFGSCSRLPPLPHVCQDSASAYPFQTRV